jgi:hypothetical protein
MILQSEFILYIPCYVEKIFLITLPWPIVLNFIDFKDKRVFLHT